MIAGRPINKRVDTLNTVTKHIAQAQLTDPSSSIIWESTVELQATHHF
jgi:hypothetical protein